MNPKLLAPAAMIAGLTLAACQKPAADEAAPAPAAAETAAAPARDAAAEPAPAEAAAPAQTHDAAPAFVGKVWEVKASSAVEPGTQYSFLADGTLVIASKNGQPGYGKWTYEGGKLTMIEEGIAYPTDILKLDADAFEIRSHNPGEPVTINLVPVANAALPAAPGG